MDKNSIEAAFQASLLTHNTDHNRYLLAISGGVDSMVLLSLFYKFRPGFQVAHCNFQLRGVEAECDEELVRAYCSTRNIPFHSVRFDVAAFKATGNYSTQMACRVLRYTWFSELMALNAMTHLVTAHHLDDNLETVLINLSRGSGLKGIAGMKTISEGMFRPLLSVARADIEAYAMANKVSWREDASNATDDYIRNTIRHHISPVLKEIHPSFNANFVQTISHLQETQWLVDNHIAELRQQLFSGEDVIHIALEPLRKLRPLDTYLHFLFQDYGFKSTTELKKLLEADSGSEIQSADFRLIKGRGEWLLKKKDVTDLQEIWIKEDQIKINSLNLKFVQSSKPLEEAKETIDFDRINHPLKLRKPINGDTFYPLGMKGQRKLVSKFCKDLKLSKIEKEAIWVLVDAQDQIVWVVNYRLDERYKINTLTKNYLNILVC